MGLFDCDCACAQAPDYSSTAAATEKSAQIMADLGREQLAESRRQYDINKETADRVVAAQLGIMDQTQQQGQDYYDYMVSQQRPVERALNDEAMDAGSESRQQVAADKAVADSQGGYTRAINQAIRQGRRYGVDPIATTGVMAVQQAQNTAAAAGVAREKEKNLGYAKKLDVAGLYRGLPGASTAAYSASTNAGNSAVQNQMAPGAALQSGMAAGANTVGQGQQLNLQGNLGILNAQTSFANSQNAMYSQMGDSGLGGLGSALGGFASLASAAKTAGGWGALFAGSSKAIKTKKRKIAAVLEGVRNLDVERWQYKKGVADGGEHVGPYAEDVRREFGDKAAPGGKVLDMISMQGIMLKAIQELDQKVDRVAGMKTGRRRVIEGTAKRVRGE